ncbi:hypothetical protein [Serratia aquatilis]|uniref:Uncharacterized protein n=1 Tax=Serratia aquatilis TaxID=1737515 RepID=A0ABV6E9Q3_9GAMM
MKYVLIALLIAPLTVTASNLEKWTMIDNSIPVLRNSDPNTPVEIMLGNENREVVAIIDKRGPGIPETICYNDGEARGVHPIGFYVINDKKVKMLGYCVSGDGIIIPETKEGKDYIHGLVWSGVPVTIDMLNGTKLSYPASDIEDLKSKIK